VAKDSEELAQDPPQAAPASRATWVVGIWDAINR
jgi:hypothetical protein